MVYIDEKSGILFYFERDGQHVSAVHPNGTILWHVNPTEQASRKESVWEGQMWRRPVISYAGPLQTWEIESARINGKHGEYISIGMLKEFGLLDIKTGEYFPTGSD